LSSYSCIVSLLWVENVLAVPSLDKFADNDEDHRIPGLIIFGSENLILNSGRNAIILKVVNNGDRPIQVFAYVLHLPPYHIYIYFLLLYIHFFHIKMVGLYSIYTKCHHFWIQCDKLPAHEITKSMSVLYIGTGFCEFFSDQLVKDLCGCQGCFWRFVIDWFLVKLSEPAIGHTYSQK